MNKAFFGFKQVDAAAKAGMVKSVFSSVAGKYDIMNDFMSFGLHRYWKAEMIKKLAPKRGDKYLDVAGGSGDIGFKVWEKGAEVVLTDINPDMLQQAKNKAVDKNVLERVSFETADAESLRFEDNTFDILGIAFGIRNVTNIDKALGEFYRVLKPGGRFVCLEFSDVENEIIQPHKIQGITTKQYFWHKSSDVGHLTLHTAAGDVHFHFGNFTEIKQLVNYWLYQVETSVENWM